MKYLSPFCFSYYDRNKEAKKIQVYFKRDEDAKAKTSGANFSAGTLALTGGAGLALGAAVTALGISKSKKTQGKQNCY